MSELPQKLKNPIRETTQDAIRLAKELIRTAAFGSLSVLDPRDGRPHVSRITIATDFDGSPITLVSRLSFHTKAMLEDRRCSLLVGEPGKGDPLAYPRVTLACDAKFIERSDPENPVIAERFLRTNPKARLYAGFGDFVFVRLHMISASLNGGFGQAFVMGGSELLSPQSEVLRRSESKLIGSLNGPESPFINPAYRNREKLPKGKIAVSAIDCEGISIVTGGKARRIWFAKPALTPKNVQNEISALIPNE